VSVLRESLEAAQSSLTHGIIDAMVFELFNGAARQALACALAGARQAGAAEASPYHIFWGVFQSAGHAGKVLRAHNITVPPTPGLEPNLGRISPLLGIQMSFSDESMRLLRRATHEAQKMESRFVETGHLLLVLMPLTEVEAVLAGSQQAVREAIIAALSQGDPESLAVAESDSGVMAGSFGVTAQMDTRQPRDEESDLAADVLYLKFAVAEILSILRRLERLFDLPGEGET
jgi:ATP-dependent Clp protease ATP-binding subunit ClpA